MTEVLVALDSVVVERNGRPILDGITWRVNEGENWAILGPNGSGKSTLLATLTGRVFPSRGVASVLGRTLGRTDLRELRCEVAYASGLVARDLPVASEAAALVATGASGVLAQWWDHPSHEVEAESRVLLEDLGAAHLVGRRFDTLSDGERQKVVLGRALMSKARLTLLDETFAGLDTGARERLVRRLETMTSPERACVVVTHHLEEIPTSTTHVALMRNGRMIDAGEVSAVVTSASISELFGLVLQVENSAGRWTCLTRPLR